MPGLDWVFRLRDEVTRPAGSMEKQLRSVTMALKTLDLAAKQARLEKMADPLKKTRLELQIHRDKLLLSKRAIDEHGRSVKTWSDSLLKWAGSLYILDVAARGFRLVARAAAEMGEQVRDAVETRQRGLFGLRTNLGSQAGGGLFGQLQAQARQYGRPPGEIVGLGAGFADVGATPDLARVLVAAVSDVRARTAGRVDISEQIRGILSSPIVGTGNVEAFRGAFPLKRLWEALGKRMNMRPGDAEQMLNLHGIQGGPGSQLLAALQDTIAGLPGQGGRIGSTATRFAASTLPGARGRVQSAWEQLLGSADSAKGMRTIQDVMQNLAQTLGSKAMREGLRDLVDSVGKLIEPLQGSQGRQRMTEFFDLIVKLAKDAAGAMGVLAKSFIGILQISGVGSDVLNILKGTPPKALSPETQALFSAFYKPPVELSPEAQLRISGSEARQAMLSTLPGARSMDAANMGLRGAERPVFNMNFHTQGSVDPGGIRKAVEREIASQQRDAGPTEINDAFEQLGVQSGAQ
jgi:hypothetical protein